MQEVNEEIADGKPPHKSLLPSTQETRCLASDVGAPSTERGRSEQTEYMLLQGGERRTEWTVQSFGDASTFCFKGCRKQVRALA